MFHRWYVDEQTVHDSMIQRCYADRKDLFVQRKLLHGLASIRKSFRGWQTRPPIINYFVLVQKAGSIVFKYMSLRNHQ